MLSFSKCDPRETLTALCLFFSVLFSALSQETATARLVGAGFIATSGFNTMWTMNPVFATLGSSCLQVLSAPACVLVFFVLPAESTLKQKQGKPTHRTNRCRNVSTFLRRHLTGSSSAPPGQTSTLNVPDPLPSLLPPTGWQNRSRTTAPSAACCCHHCRRPTGDQMGELRGKYAAAFSLSGGIKN